MYMIFYIVLGIFSSSGQESKIKIEMKAISDIFPDLCNESTTYLISPPIPPPPPPQFDSNGNPIGYDTASYEKYVEQIKVEIEERKKDTTKYIVAIYDTLISYESNYNDLDSYLTNQSIKDYHEPIKYLYSKTKENRKVDITKIKHGIKYELRYNSTLPGSEEIWKTELDFKFLGIFQFSRVYFDTLENYGVLYSAYYCGRLCAYGDLILIKKVNGIWQIAEKIGLWVS